MPPRRLLRCATIGRLGHGELASGLAQVQTEGLARLIAGLPGALAAAREKPDLQRPDRGTIIDMER